MTHGDGGRRGGSFISGEFVGFVWDGELEELRDDFRARGCVLVTATMKGVPYACAAYVAYCIILLAKVPL